MSVAPTQFRSRWADAWWDGVAFAGGLAMAWFGNWETADLVWSLWLSSFVVGYALIIWKVTSTLREFVTNAGRDRSADATAGRIGVGLAIGAGSLFLLGFFTVHFGGFHVVHSMFLSHFFPLEENAAGSSGFLNLALYGEVVRRYWIFVPLAFLAEREAFRSTVVVAPDVAVTAEAITRRKQSAMKEGMAAPYKNVIRMHLLIFFFAAAHFAQIDHFAVYAVVYAVYFFPWRLVKPQPAKVVQVT